MTKIQINSLEALERLIGNDNELEIDIRNNIVESFTKKHLKALVNTETIKDLESAVKKEVSSYFSFYPTRTYLSKEFSKIVRDSITDEANAIVYKEVRDLINLEIKKITDTSYVKDMVDYYIKTDLVKKISDELLNKVIKSLNG